MKYNPHRLKEVLEYVLRRHVGQRLLGARRHSVLHHDDGARDVLLLEIC